MHIRTIRKTWLQTAWLVFFVTFSAAIFQILGAARFIRWESEYGVFFIILSAAATVFGMAFLPRVVARKMLGLLPDQTGWRLPTAGFLCHTGIVICAMLPVTLFLATRSEFLRYYGVTNLTPGHFLFTGVFLPLIIYGSQEYLVRGYLFFPLYKRIGAWSIFINIIFAMLAHIGKPKLEIFLFEPLISTALCWLSLKTKSFVPAAIAHYVLALIFEILVQFVFSGQATKTILIF